MFGFLQDVALGESAGLLRNDTVELVIGASTYVDGSRTGYTPDAVVFGDLVLQSAPVVVYRYTFEINVPAEGTIVYVGRTVKMNGKYPENWDKFLGFTTPIDPTTFRTNSMSDLYPRSTEGPSFYDHQGTQGAVIFEALTSERVDFFEMATYRNKYRPGWNVYENGVLLLSETVNGGGSDSPASHDVWHTLTLRLTPAHTVTFNSVSIDGTVIGSSGITVDGTTYATENVGRVQTDENGFNYLEMTTNGRLTLPAYAPDVSSIAHTVYFVARAQDETGVIRRFIHPSGDNFNMHIASTHTNMWPFTFNYPGGSSNQIASATVPPAFSPKDSIFVMVIKVQRTGTRAYNIRIQMASKPDGTVEYAGMTEEVAGNSTSNRELGTQLAVGTNPVNAEADNMKFYEYGVYNSYMDDTDFDVLMQSLVADYLI
jgi:hypothetical protein